jgi:hypothetical protein
MNQTHPIQTSHLIFLILTFVLPSRDNTVSTLNRKILGSNLGSSKRAMSSPKHPDQLQYPPSLQFNVNQRFLSGSKVVRGLSLITHVCLVPSLKFSGAIPPPNLCVSMAQIGTLFYLYLPTMYPSQKITSFQVFLYITYFSLTQCLTHLLIQIHLRYEEFQ